MEYIDVQWEHSAADEPVRLVSELDENRAEVRKLEFFADGRVGFASLSASLGGTVLGEGAVPSLVEINADPQFAGRSMEAAEFEELWTLHADRDA